jgi:predicted Zn-dependent protease
MQQSTPFMAAKHVTRVLLAGFAAACLSGCGEEKTKRAQPTPSVIFSAATKHVMLEVDYAATASPYAETDSTLGNIWDLTKDNLDALFSRTPKDIVLPESLADMEQIDVPHGPYTADDLVNIAMEHRQQPSHGDTVTFYAVWLDGFYATSDGEDDTVLGAALPDYGIVAIFKPVVTSAGPMNSSVARFTEQSALIHELGHALGLVNIGLPLTSPHEDAAHHGHCNNPRCVMYWANEGGPALFRFASDVLNTGNKILFDDACLADAHMTADGGN